MATKIDDAFERRFYFAKWTWVHRNQKAPSGIKTWGQRFQEIYGMSLEEYAELAKKEDHRGMIRQHQIERLGYSRL